MGRETWVVPGVHLSLMFYGSDQERESSGPALSQTLPSLQSPGCSFCSSRPPWPRGVEWKHRAQGRPVLSEGFLCNGHLVGSAYCFSQPCPQSYNNHEASNDHLWSVWASKFFACAISNAHDNNAMTRWSLTVSSADKENEAQRCLVSFLRAHIMKNLLLTTHSFLLNNVCKIG